MASATQAQGTQQSTSSAGSAPMSEAQQKREIELAQLEALQSKESKALTVGIVLDDSTADAKTLRSVFNSYKGMSEVNDACFVEAESLTMDAKSVRQYMSALLDNDAKENNGKRDTFLAERVARFCSLYSIRRTLRAQGVEIRGVNDARLLLLSHLVEGFKANVLNVAWTIPAGGVCSAEVSRKVLAEKESDNAIVQYRAWLLSCDVRRDAQASFKIALASTLRAYVEALRAQKKANVEIQNYKKTVYSNARKS